MKTLFISIPITGKDIEEVKAKCSALKDKIKGDCRVLTPFDIIGWHEGESWEWYMARTIDMIWSCDIVYMCEGWADSQGCRLEYEVARFSMNKTIIFE